jgi:hypothetical protein
VLPAATAVPHGFGLTKEQFNKQVDMMARRGQTLGKDRA